MATLLKNNSSVGVYILEDEGGWVAANTPGEADLDNLAVGDTYIYFDSVISLQHKVTSNYESDDRPGFKTWYSGSLSIKSNGGFGARFGYILLSAEVDATTQANFELFYNRNCVTGDGQKYLVRQWASETFRQFPYQSANKNYAKIIMRGYDITEVEDKGKDVQLLNIAMEEVTSRLG